MTNYLEEIVHLQVWGDFVTAYTDTLQAQGRAATSQRPKVAFFVLLQLLPMSGLCFAALLLALTHGLQKAEQLQHP